MKDTCKLIVRIRQDRWVTASSRDRCQATKSALHSGGDGNPLETCDHESDMIKKGASRTLNSVG